MLATIGIGILLGVTAISGAMALMEGRFIYFPDREVTATPASAGLAYQDRWPTTDDGVQLHAWYLPDPQARYTVLAFHGNAGNMADRVGHYARWRGWGLAVYAIDYRGYGRSEGAPSEQGLYRDARAAWADVTRELGVPPDRVIVVGRSLGSGPAVRLAAEVGPAALVIENPMTSMPAMARVVYPFLPVSLLTRTKFDNLGTISRVACPVMVIHAEQDEVIPSWMGRRVYEAARDPKHWVPLTGRHNDFDEVSATGYHAAWQIFLGSLPDRR
jgi:fermentation-respiration switch protein FrsA (DUF1100 family)